MRLFNHFSPSPAFFPKERESKGKTSSPFPSPQKKQEKVSGTLSSEKLYKGHGGDISKFFATECKFCIAAHHIEDIPPSGLGEVAFAGRSNVGKSSLINAITNQSHLARTSQTPGCTKSVNFFRMNEASFLVDLPGYGYAKVGKQESLSWGRLIKDYLRGRAQLKRVFLLIDSRHGLKESDIDIMGLLDDSAVPYQIVLTKLDKASKTEITNAEATIEKIALRHPAMHPKLLKTSSQTKEGIDEIRLEIFAIANNLNLDNFD